MQVKVPAFAAQCPAAHGVQVAAPIAPSVDIPPTQAVQETEPVVPTVECPAAHGVQVEAPAFAAQCPGAHGVQVAAPIAPSVDIPPTQAVQETEPVVPTVECPAAHGVQVEAPAFAAQCPGAHGAQVAVPATPPVDFPATHDEHTCPSPPM